METPAVDERGGRLRKWGPVGAEAVLVCLLCAGVVQLYLERVDLPLYEPDEAAWIFSSYYHHLYFERGEFFHDDNVAVPIIDRVIHHSHIFMLGGESYRLKQKVTS